MKLQRLHEYNQNDLSMYFSHHRSFVPFIDSKGRKRVAKILSNHGKTIQYQSISLDKKSLSKNTFERQAKDFAYTGMMVSKFIKSKDGLVHRISPIGARTVAKSMTERTFLYKGIHEQNNHGIVRHLEYVWKYFWQVPEYTKRPQFNMKKSCILTAELAYCSDTRTVSISGAKSISVKNINDVYNIVEELQ